MRKILVTAALTYANGPIHLGHMLEYIQADVFVRALKSQGHDVLYIGGDDAHGTAIMLSAEKHQISPETLIAQVHQEHQQVLQGFLINLDNFHTTHSPENRELSTLVYQRLCENNDISQKVIMQAYDPERHIFLPDRFIRGQCPHCDAADQYGDSCEVCGSTYSPMELIAPKSALSGAAPIQKESLHFFFELEKYRHILQEWVCRGHLQTQVTNKLKEWFDDELKPWDISRDAPYFGFEIPDAPSKYFYVWLDAPIGYMASLKNLCARKPELCFDDYWQNKNNTEVYHFIGKDIVYFHALFWPAMLTGAQLRLPTNIFVHGYLTINSEKMSKSRGTFITAATYLNCLDPEYLRYYFSAKLSPQVEDIDLSLEDFAQRVNSDLVGKYINLASRCAGFITKQFDGELADHIDNPELFTEFVQQQAVIADYFESLNFSKAVRAIMSLADRANQYIDHEKPWVLAKDSANRQKVQAVCTMGLNLFKILTAYLKPILVNTAARVEEFLAIEPLNGQNLAAPLLAHKITAFKPLMQRITPEQLAALTENLT